MASVHRGAHQMEQQPFGLGGLLGALDFYLRKPR